MIRTSDRLIAPSRGDRVTAVNSAVRLGAKRIDEVDSLVIAYYDIGPKIGIDPAIATAAAFVETGNFTNRWWRERLNAGSLGVTGDPDQNEASPTFASGNAAAQAHLAHLLVYALGPGVALTRWREAGLGSLRDVDPRYDAYLDAFGMTAKAPTIAGLSGAYAADRNYANAIVARAADVYGPTIPDQEDASPMPLNMTHGLIPLPPTIDHLVNVAARNQSNDCRGYDNLGGRRIRGVVLHRSQGTWPGNISHFDSNCPGALTDLQVHHEDGRMMRFVRLAAPTASIDAPSGWANGRVSEPYGDGKAFVDRYGIVAVNRDLESCEITGYFAQPGQTTREDPVAAVCWETLAQWIASRAHDYGITYETFPRIPAEGDRSFVIWHQEFTIGTGKVCPGRVVMDGTTALIDRARAIMMEAQTGAGPIEPPSPFPSEPIPAPDEYRAQGHALRPLSPRRRTATTGTTRRTAPHRDAPAATKTPIRAGHTYTFDWETEVSGERWFVSRSGSWALAAAFKEAA